MLNWVMRYRTVSLIGMPGAGKSTVGVLVAKRLGLNFVDSDLLIQVRAGLTLQQIIDAEGYLALRSLEEEILLEMPLDDFLVATGGSVVYSERGMRRLQAAGPIVYLECALNVLAQRVAAHSERGIAAPQGHDFAAIYRERVPLYERYADVRVAGDAQSAEETAELIARELGCR